MELPAGPPPIIATSKSGFVRTNVMLLKIFSRWGAVKNRSRGMTSANCVSISYFACAACQGDLLLHWASIFVVTSPVLPEAYRDEKTGGPEVRIIFAKFSLWGKNR